MRRLPQVQDPRLLVGSATADDAGVYRIDKDRALVQTVDFFTPIVDDPYAYGQIAAANALSDVYAMGGRPLTALNLMGIPEDLVPPPVINAILRGGSAKAREVGCVIVGGHTIRNPEPIYGLAVTGIVSPRRLITNAAARPGDLLVLTKPLGTGIVTTGIKRGITSPALARRAIQVMKQINTAGADLAVGGWVRAGTDVTGYGVLGHLASLCRASGVGSCLEAGKFPVLSPEVLDLVSRDCIPGGTRENLRAAASLTEWTDVSEPWRYLLADAQTSGGLLFCVAPRHLEAARRVLKRHRTVASAVVGRIVASNKPRIWVNP